MPVASETSRIQYTGNGSTVTAYTVPFYFLANADIIVVLTTAAGVETTLTETTHYVLTGAGVSSGGSLTTVSAYDNTHTITIYREPQQTQSAEFQATGALPAATLTRGLDKLTMLVQSLSRKVARTLRLNDKAGEVTAFEEGDRESTVVGFDSAGDGKLYDTAALLSLLSLSGSVTGASTAYWADDGERALKVPDFTGQLGLQLDTSAIYRSTGTSAGNWTQFNFTGLAGTLAIGQVSDALLTYAKLQNISTTQRLLGRNTAGAGVAEEVTLSQLLDWIGSAAQGDILYRGAANWERLAAGTAGLPLITKGAGQNPAWEASYASGTILQEVTTIDGTVYTTTSTTPAFDSSIPQISEGTAITNLSVTVTPKLASSTLVVECLVHVSASVSTPISAALFRDSTANAIAASACRVHDTSSLEPLLIRAKIASTSQTATTISARFGTVSGTAAINQTGAVSDLFGSSLVSSITIREVAP